MTEHFTLLSELGRGGMGVVWKARDEETGQTVAIKLLHPVFAADPDYVTRFERELELAKRIHSRNVVQVLGFGVREGTPYLALEYIDGPSLRERLATHGPYAWPEAKALLAQIAQGLADAHAAGVIHRDLKPSNVLIGSDGVAKIADFGIAKGLDLTRVTGTSTLLGTPAYLPPEGPADERSDLYSLGIIAYEILTGVVPFDGRTYQEVILRHVREAPDLTRVPKDARSIVGRLLAKDPKKRPQRASDVAEELSGATPRSGQMVAAGARPRPELPRERGAGVRAVAGAGSARGRPFGVRSTRFAVLAGGVALSLVAVSLFAGLVLGQPGIASASSTPQSILDSPSITSTHLTPPTATSSTPTFARTRSVSPTTPATPGPTAKLTPTPLSTPTPTPGPTSPTLQPTVQPTPTPTQAGAFIRGVVTASEGGALAGIDVIVDDCGFGTCGNGGDAISQSDGSYAVGPLDPGKYEITWEDPSGRRAPVRLTAGGASPFPNDNYHVDVGGSTVSGIDAAMPLGGRVTGTLTPAPGKSLPAQVTITPIWLSGGWGWYPWDGQMNADGTYSTGVLPAGTYDLMIDNGSTSVYWSSSGLTTDQSSATPVTISSSDVGGINGQLPW